MKPSQETITLRIGGMTCVNCQNRIENKLLGTTGVQSAAVRYHAGTAVVTYDANILSVDAITDIIENLEYKVLSQNERRTAGTGRIAGLLLVIAVLFFLLEYFGVLNRLAPNRLAEETMGYGMLFVIGLITSVHCIAMCGGINLSQCIPRGNDAGKSRLSAFAPAFLYNLGRVISYTAVGFTVGALGSAIAFSSTMQGVLKLIAGVFMIVMGINMLGIFPSARLGSWLRKLNPSMPKIFAQKINKEKAQSKSPLIVGLLNGLMPCGPLQAMQIYALSTGNAFSGALSMLLFSLGTVPLMFGLGAVSSALGKKFTAKVMTAGAVWVVVLGLSMMTQGWRLSEFKSAQPPSNGISSQSGEQNQEGVQIINSTLSFRGYPNITVRAGIPVKWIINAPQGSITGCNNRMILGEYGIEHTFTPGENVIEFTPTRAGKFQYTCWMGMIKATITVTEAKQ
ncbi:MAG: sulfite exporter TauE/SafE family protein [Firmicutes bacterium]|nr:sulfite exporter TauE/SafE family protein [Bacillota bacterium]